jgi:hypothetical protein
MQQSDHTKVSIGPTSIAGWATAVAAMIPVIVKAIEEGKASFVVGGPEKWLAIFGIVIAAVTQIGRNAQSVAQVRAAPLAAAAAPALAGIDQEEAAYAEVENAEQSELSATPDGAEQAEPPEGG